MQKQFTCEVTTAQGQVFEIIYQSTQERKEEAWKPINVIREVKFWGYVLALGQLRERTIWYELVDAIDNNSYSMWEQYWKQKPLDTSNLHPVFANVFDSLASIIKPAQNQIEDIANLSQQGAEC